MPRTTFRLWVAPVLHIEMALHPTEESVEESSAPPDKSQKTVIMKY